VGGDADEVGGDGGLVGPETSTFLSPSGTSPAR